METIWKVILSVFVSVMIIFSGIAILGANHAAAAAEHYLYAAANEISASNFAEAVRLDKIAEAAQRDYVLSVRMVGEETENAFYTNYAVLTMEYPYDIPLIKLHRRQTKQLIVY